MIKAKPEVPVERILVTDDVVMVRWHAFTLDGLKRVDEALHRLPAKQAVYVGLVGNDTEMPSDEVRKAMALNLPHMQAHCITVNLVLDGTGLRFAALRSVAAAMFLIQGNRQMHMYSTLEQALQVTRPNHVATVLHAAQQAGLVS
jgi:hypothetical protein